MNHLYLSIIIIMVVTSSMPSQQRNRIVAPVKSEVTSDPFLIKSGSSFAASSSQKSSTYETGSKSTSSDQSQIVSDIEQAFELIRRHHVSGEKTPPDQLTKYSIESMLRVLDPHSNYFDPREFEALLNQQNSEYIGIGISIENFSFNRKIETYITSVFAASSAQRAGLRFGDKIVAVDGVLTSGLDSISVRDKIRGARNTKVKLRIERAGDFQTTDLLLPRVSVPQPSIPDSYLLEKGIGYIDLGNGFNYSTASELRSALRQLRLQGAKSLILDLRDNPGGIVEQAVKVAETFLPFGTTIVSQRGRSSFDNRIWKSQNRQPENMPVVVLVNSGSASASEILAGALQDNDRAILVGEKTFGKGLVQSVLNLPFGNGLTLTTARYFTPTGRSIQRSYSLGNLYDYYKHQPRQQSVGGFLAVKTSSGRTLYGGDGITPDLTIGSRISTPTENSLLDPIFFFSMEAFAGRLQNFEINEEILKTAGDSPANNSLIDHEAKIIHAFREYLATADTLNVSPELVEQNRHFIAKQIRYLLATAESGRTRADRMRSEDDSQLQRAIDAIPVAQNLYRKTPNAKSIRKTPRAKI